MTNHTHHIGYATLEKFAEDTNPYADVYAMLITEPGKTGTHGIQTDRLIITCQRLEGELVHYCRIPVGSLTYIGGGQPFDPNAQERKDWALQAFEIVKDWLTEQAFRLIPSATVAMPLDYRYLDGWADFLTFDKETGFSRLEAEIKSQEQ